MLRKVGEDDNGEESLTNDYLNTLGPPIAPSSANSSRRPSIGGPVEFQVPTSNMRKSLTPNYEPKTNSRRPSVNNSFNSGRRSTKHAVVSRPPPAEPTVSVVVGGNEFQMVSRPGRLAALNIIRSQDNGTDQDTTIPLPARSHMDRHLSVDSDIEDFQLFMTETRHPAIVIDVLSDPHDKTIVSEFDELCNELLNCLGELEMSIEELTLFKGSLPIFANCIDEFLKQSAPSNVKLKMTLMFARLFRSKSDMHDPLFEMVKQVRLFSRPWVNKKLAITELEADYRR